MQRGLSESKSPSTIQPDSKAEVRQKQFNDRYGTGEHFDHKKFEHDARAGKIPGVRYAPRHAPTDDQGVQNMKFKK